MELIKAIGDRRARRALDNRSIEPDVRDRILQAATLAPSCGNSQPWRFIAVEGQASLAALKECLEGGNYWGRPAPLIIAVVTNPEWDAKLDGNRDYAYFDTGMACMNLMIQATSEGLYAHPIAGFKPFAAKEVLGIPAEHTLLTLIICGYPGSDAGLNDRHKESESSERTRKSQDQIVALDHWEDILVPAPKPKT